MARSQRSSKPARKAVVMRTSTVEKVDESGAVTQPKGVKVETEVPGQVSSYTPKYGAVDTSDAALTYLWFGHGSRAKGRLRSYLIKFWGLDADATSNGWMAALPRAAVGGRYAASVAALHTRSARRRVPASLAVGVVCADVVARTARYVVAQRHHVGGDELTGRGGMPALEPVGGAMPMVSEGDNKREREGGGREGERNEKERQQESQREGSNEKGTVRVRERERRRRRE